MLETFSSTSSEDSPRCKPMPSAETIQTRSRSSSDEVPITPSLDGDSYTNFYFEENPRRFQEVILQQEMNALSFCNSTYFRSFFLIYETRAFLPVTGILDILSLSLSLSLFLSFIFF